MVTYRHLGHHLFGTYHQLLSNLYLCFTCAGSIDNLVCMLKSTYNCHCHKVSDLHVVCGQKRTNQREKFCRLNAVWRPWLYTHIPCMLDELPHNIYKISAVPDLWAADNITVPSAGTAGQSRQGRAGQGGAGQGRGMEVQAIYL